jgi:hypothetical protein
MRSFFRVRQLVAIAGVAICMAAAPGDGRSPLVLTCTNPASGATWQISVDLGKSTVDANPARVNDTAITWRDGKDGANYTLDRRTGALTATVPSSTGGYFLHHRCQLPP